MRVTKNGGLYVILLLVRGLRAPYNPQRAPRGGGFAPRDPPEGAPPLSKPRRAGGQLGAWGCVFGDEPKNARRYGTRVLFGVPGRSLGRAKAGASLERARRSTQRNTREESKQFPQEKPGGKVRSSLNRENPKPGCIGTLLRKAEVTPKLVNIRAVQNLSHG